MNTIGVIKDVEYDIDTNQIKNIDIAIIDGNTNEIKVITIKSSILARTDMKDFPFEPFGAVEYSKKSNMIRPLFLLTEEQKGIVNKIFHEIIKDPFTLALWEQCLMQSLEQLESHAPSKHTN